jgi:hypothetical protein
MLQMGVVEDDDDDEQEPVEPITSPCNSRVQRVKRKKPV